jgi:predicted aldo/keto reductase-like oxidoreductase
MSNFKINRLSINKVVKVNKHTNNFNHSDCAMCNYVCPKQQELIMHLKHNILELQKEVFKLQEQLGIIEPISRHK